MKKHDLGHKFWLQRYSAGALSLALLACNNPGAGTSVSSTASSAGTTSAGGSSASESPSTIATLFQFGSDSSSLTPVGDAGGEAGTPSGDGGSSGSGQPSPSTRCGDAVVGADEECDDGDDGSDGCTAQCLTRDQLVVPAPALALPHSFSRSLGRGRHPMAGGDFGFITLYTEPDEDEPLVGATVFNEQGQATFRGTVSIGSLPITDANPVAAALPNGEYALAWNDFGGDGSELGIALRKVQASGDLGSLRAANAGTEFSQSDPDVLWVGDQLVVAWVDYANAELGPDIRYRTFDADLSPVSGDIALADSSTWEADVALATFGNSWAAAYREGTVDGRENIVVKSGEQAWRVGPVLGGAEGEKPSLVELDSTHLLVAYTEGTDPSLSGVANTPRLRYAVIDTTVVAAPLARSLAGPDSFSSEEQLVSQMSPVLERGLDGVFLAWRAEARPGDAAGDQLWLKSLGWSSRGPSGTPELVEHDAELLIPRLCESSTGDQRAPALARTNLYPNGALAIAWDDYSHSLDATSGAPDVVVHYAPDHPARQSASSPELLTESWTGQTGDLWPDRWLLEYDSTKTKPQIYHGEGQFASLSGAATSIATLREPVALNADVVVRFRFNLSSTALGIVLRRSADDPSSYFLAKLSAIQGDLWRIQAINSGVATDVVTMPMPPNFYDWSGYQTSYVMRFRAATNGDGSVSLGMKGWALGMPEPATWQLSSTLPASSSLLTQLGTRPGRIGLLGQVGGTGRNVYLDDFRALYFQGLGDLDMPRNAALQALQRSAAQYRRCKPGALCAENEGCCTSDADCVSGSMCLPNQGEFRGLGSHASLCTASHCADLTKNEDEVLADAGGSDCAPRACSPTAAPGQQNYCTQTCPCGVGEADCIVDGHCLPGLSCGRERQEQYTGVDGFDACVPLHCLNRVQDADETLADCGGSCGDHCACSPVNDGHWHCRVYCPCETGHGDCNADDECAPGLVCGFNIGDRYGFALNRGICVPPVCLNGKKDTAAGETSIDFGGPCIAPTGLTLAEALADFPILQYRKVTYGLETGDYLVVPTATPLTGQVTSPVFKRANRFLFNVPVTVDVSMTFNVGNVGASSNPAIDLKLYNSAGTLVKSVVLPSSSGQTIGTTVLLGRLGGNYEMELSPHDDALTYSITRTASTAPNMAVKDGVDFTGPAAPLYFYVPAEVDTAFLLGNFDPATSVRFFAPDGAEVTPLHVADKVYALDTHGKPGVWQTTFRTSSLRAHLVNLPDVFSFDPSSVFGSKIIRTRLDYGTPTPSSFTMQYLRGSNRFAFHVVSPSSPTFTIKFEDGLASPPMTEVRLLAWDGTALPGSPLSLPVGENSVSAGLLQPGDYLLEIPSPASTTRYLITVPAGVPFVSLDGFNNGNVWLAHYRDYFYVPNGTTAVRFGSSNANSIFTIYDGSGVLVAGQPVPLGNGVFEIQNTTAGTWAMNVQGSTNVRFLNLTQAIGFHPTIQALPQASPPHTCVSSADCSGDQVCGSNNGARFGRPATDDLCWAASCAATPPANLCGSVLSPCGTCP